MQVFAVVGRAGFAHLGIETHGQACVVTGDVSAGAAGVPAVGGEGDADAEVADQRADDVAFPARR